ncbi:MAG: ABC transporter ATP-binding protein [Candidatus Omnitrophota bacterium]|nr:ABC transporter ATP-binding protein [Candidatus Omnitrophota bacterium]
MRPALFSIPAVMALAAALFEALSLGLLIPLTNAILGQDTVAIRSLPFANTALGWFPKMAASDSILYGVMIVLVFTAAVVKVLLQYGSRTSAAYLIRDFTHRARCRLFEQYLSYGKLFFDKYNTGHLHQVLVTFTQQVAYHFSQCQNFLIYLFLLVIYIVLLCAISWKLTIISVMIFPVLYFALNWVIAKIRRSSEDNANQERELGKKIHNVLSCIPLVKAYTQEKFEKREFSKMSQMIRMFEFSIDKKLNFMSPAQEIIMLSGILLLMLCVGLLVAKDGTSSGIGAYLVYFVVLRRASASFGSVNNLKGEIAAVRGPLREIGAILMNNDEFIVQEGCREFADLGEKIEFRNLTFSYREERAILKNLSFSINRGEMTAIVGPTGAGKTTIAHLILRFYDAPQGTLLLDGVDIREFTLASLRRSMAIVSQDIHLFNDTLRSNLLYGIGPGVGEERLTRIIEQARLTNYVRELPSGLDAIIGDRGVQLSGGEKQRVSIARALLKNADILILDEATSALDSETERIVQEAVQEVVKGRTTIVIAHRLSTIKNAAKIIYIENGMILECGTPAALLESKGKFYQAWTEQKMV